MRADLQFKVYEYISKHGSFRDVIGSDFVCNHCLISSIDFGYLKLRLVTSANKLAS